MKITIFYSEKLDDKHWQGKVIKTSPTPEYVEIVNNSPAETTDKEIWTFLQELPLEIALNHYVSLNKGENPPPAETILVARTYKNPEGGLTVWLLISKEYRLCFHRVDPTSKTSPFSFWRWDRGGYLRLAMPPHRLYLDIQGTTFSRKPAYK